MILHTDRTSIIPLSETDIPEILEMYGEPDSFKYILPHKDKSEAYYLKFLKGKIETNKQTLGIWTVRLKVNNEFIGTVNLNQFQNSEMTHIGCHLKTAMWNKGFATELMKELMKYGFEQRNLNAIHGIVEENNVISAKLMKVLGFNVFKERMDNGVNLIIYRKLKT